ncbi:hypothetical protein Tco_1553963 [Tanacetum coccineum]
MHTSKDDYLINTLKFVSTKEETQIYGAILPESLTSPEIKETKAYKTYLGFDTGATPPKTARKFKKPASPQLTTVPISPEGPTGKSKETPEMPLSKKKEKVDVARGKGIELLSDVALTEEAYFAKIKPSITNEGTCVKPGVLDVTEEESSENEVESWGNDEDDSNNEQDSSEVKDEFVKTPSNDSNDEDETKTTNKAEGDEDEDMDYTTSQLYDDVDIRLNEPVDIDKGFIQEDVIEDAHVTLSTVPQKTEVLVTSSSHSSDLAAKFINFSDIPHTDAEIVSPIDVHVHHEVPSQQTPTLLIVPVSVITDSSPDDPLKNQVTALVDEHLDARLGSTRDEFMNFLLVSLAERTIEQVKNQPPQILPEEVSNFPLSDTKDGTKSQPKSSGKSVQSEEPEFEVADSDITQDQEGNLEPTNPDWNVGITPQQGQNQSWLMTLASSANKPSMTFDESMITPINFSAYIMNGLKITNLTQETLLGPVFRLLKGTRSNYAKLEYDFEECYKPLSEKLDWENPEGGDYQFDLTKSLPLVMSRNHQKVPVDYFFNNDLKYMQIGVSTMTYTTSITKTKATQYDLLGIEDMVEVMRKHRYGYLKEIGVRRADNDLYRFKECDFPRLHINDIEDMLLLIV